MTSAAADRATPTRIALAWAVHAFTASGALVGVAALLAIAAGSLPRAALWMVVALTIDAVDGSLARSVQVDRVLPGFDGRRLDDIVDYLNYVIVPAVFMVAAGGLSHWSWVALPILASAYGFSQIAAKTEDDFFLGFPSYWNVIALYLWLLAIPAGVGTALVAAFSALVFVPFKYVYPSRLRVLRRTTNALAAAWLVVLAFAVLRPERAQDLRLVQASLAFPAYYLVLSFWLGGLYRRRA